MELKEITVSQLIKLLQDLKPSNRDPIVRFYDMTDDKCDAVFYLKSVGSVEQFNRLGPTEFIITLGKGSVTF